MKMTLEKLLKIQEYYLDWLFIMKVPFCHSEQEDLRLLKMKMT